MDTYCQVLDWDTSFFGYKVGRIDAINRRKTQLERDVANLLSEGCKLMYVFSTSPVEWETITSVRTFLADLKRSYVMSPAAMSKLAVDVRPFKGNSSDLHDLAIEAGKYSRYSVDPEIKEDDFRRLYECWIDNSVSGSFADYVFTAWVNGKEVGLITASEKNGYLSIGLLATDSRYRNQGIGRALVHQICNEAVSRHLGVEVTTQATNENACAFYEKLGFVKDSEEYVYHIRDVRN